MEYSKLQFIIDSAPTDLIVLKVATNGLVRKGRPIPSVVGVSATRYRLSSDSILSPSAAYERFYFPAEPYDASATARHGLDEQALSAKRDGCTYPPQFKDDEDSLSDFCQGVTNFVGYGITTFESLFLPWLRNPAYTVIDLMVDNAAIVRAGVSEYSGTWRYPTLLETSRHYHIHMAQESTRSNMYSVRLIALIFREMVGRTVAAARIKQKAVTD